MKTTGKVFIAIGALVVLAVAALFLLLSNLDRIVAAAIEKYGSEATGTKVSVSSVDIELKAGEGSIRNLRVGNPGGFASPEAIRLENITIAVDTGSVTKDPLVIDKVIVRAPLVTYEINKTGESNIDAIRRNLEKSRAARARKEKIADEGGKKIVIRKLIIENGKVDVRVAALADKPITATLARIEMNNLGGKGGDSPGAIARQIAGSLTSRASLAASGAGVGRFLDIGMEKIGETGKEAAKGAEEAVRKLFGK